MRVFERLCLARRMRAFGLAVAVLSEIFLLPPPVVSAATFMNAQIDELVSGIALYPDPLLQAILPAATFPDQIADAALLIRSKADAELIKDQSWDDSVKVVATYPGVLKMMYERLDWTTNLGVAFLTQSQDVLDEIQVLRARAKLHGNLKSTDQQKVESQTAPDGGTVITIVPSDPQVVYVPQETSTVVYTETVDSTASALVPVATFGLGVALGAAIANHNDDGYVYYSGGPWRGPMWARNDSFNRWVDMRHSRNEDRHDEIMDRQDARQDRRAGRQDFRQDWAREHPGQINQGNLQQARQNFQNNQPQRQQQLQQARANMQSHGLTGTRVAQTRTTTATSSWGGHGGSTFASRSASRGSMSRLGGGFSRGGGFRGRR